MGAFVYIFMDCTTPVDILQGFLHAHEPCLNLLLALLKAKKMVKYIGYCLMKLRMKKKEQLRRI